MPPQAAPEHYNRLEFYMKLIHTGDIHLGCTPDAGTDWSRARSRDIWRTFEDIIKAAESEGAKLLLICGDLFHRQPLLKELNEADSIFSLAVNTQIVITAGNHDYMIPGSAYYGFKWNDNVHFLKSENFEQLELPELNTVIHGFSYHGTGPDAGLNGTLETLKCPDDGKTHILMLHGGDTDHLPLDFNRLKNSGFDYIALGHIHKPQIFDDSPMAYCGSPEPLDKTERGSHGYMLVTLSKNMPANIKFVPAAHSVYTGCRINVTPDSTISSLRNTISRVISEKGCGNIYSFTLAGRRSFNTCFELSDFSDLGRIIEIKDETIPDYDFQALRVKHSGDLIDKFIRTMLGDNRDAESLSDTQRSALYYGLNALLESTDANGGAQ